MLLHGSAAAPAERVRLRAGPLSAEYEEGALRYVRLGECEVLRYLYAAVRGPVWDTVRPVISDLRIDSGDDHFEVRFTAHHQRGEIDFSWFGHIAGDAHGTIRFSMDGTVNRAFKRNRIGFCVLHPMECAGRPVELIKADGSRERREFPQAIAPHQPFRDLAGMIHVVRPGVRAEVRFEGDIFETEDQRNWTDASFKTYCTPLRLPHPVEVKAGERVRQSVSLGLHLDPSGPGELGEADEQPASARRSSPRPLTVTLGEGGAAPLPPIGLGVASHRQPLSSGELIRLKALNLAHLRVDLPLCEPDVEDRLRQASAEARALGAVLEIALFVTDGAREELEHLRGIWPRVAPPVATWLVFHASELSTQAKWVALARPTLTALAPTAKLGGGTNAYFTELNRYRPPVDVLDLVAYSINPQVHAFDDASLVETLDAQRVTIESARRIVGDKPLAVTPVTLRPRLQPNGSPPEPLAVPGELPPQVDVRQTSLFGAAWTLASLSSIAEAGADSVTVYETTGWRGVMETEHGSPLPDQFPSRPGMVFPLYLVLAAVGACAGGRVLPSRTSDPLRIAALAARAGGLRRILVSNLSPETQTVSVSGTPATLWVRHLNEETIEQAIRDPQAFGQERGTPMTAANGCLELELLPYGVARLDYPERSSTL